MKSTIFTIFGLIAVVAAFGSSDERFIKKYAMMKIYESCFGAEVVKEIRREMKAACAKCAALSDPSPPPPMTQQPIYAGRYPPMGFMGNIPPNNKLGELGPDQNQNEIPIGQMPVAINLPMQQEQSNVGVDKLHQLLMNLYSQQQQQQQQIPQVQDYQSPSFAFRQPYYPSPYQAGYPYVQQYPFLQQQQQQSQLQNVPFMQNFQGFPVFRNRMSRDMDLRNKLEVLTSRSSGKVRNVTCVMQELGYLDHNLEPNFEKIAERIDNLPVANELKNDMQDGLQFCQKFASCVPDTKRENSPLSRELIKPMFFFRCYKHKKLEACVMKDVRDRFSNEEDIDGDADFRSMSRVGKAMKNGESTTQTIGDEMDDIAVSVYDFLYGNNDMDLESVL